MALVIGGRCSARYTGRIDAELGLGDVIVIVRDDGSVLVYSAVEGVKPRNWMPSGSTITWPTQSHMIADHEGRGERLEIFFDSFYLHDRVEAGIHPSLDLVGRESDLADMIAERPALIGRPDLKLVAREHQTNAGPIDILFTDPAADAPFIIEVKRRKAAVPDLYQWFRYQDAIREQKQVTAKGMIVAPSFTKGMLERCKQENHVEIFRLTFEQAVEDPSPAGE